MKHPFNASFYVSFFTLIALVYGAAPFQPSRYHVNPDAFRVMAKKFYALETTTCGDAQCYPAFPQFPPIP